MQMMGCGAADSSHTFSMDSGTPSTYFCPSDCKISSLAASSVLSSLKACNARQLPYQTLWLCYIAFFGMS